MQRKAGFRVQNLRGRRVVLSRCPDSLWNGKATAEVVNAFAFL
jgi:hypothetical protein